MNGHTDTSSSPDAEEVEEQDFSSRDTSFDVDDAFEESGEDPDFEFSSEALRSELAKTLRTVHNSEEPSEVHLQDSHVQMNLGYPTPDDSVSTIDIDSSTLHNLPPVLNIPLPDSPDLTAGYETYDDSVDETDFRDVSLNENTQARPDTTFEGSIEPSPRKFPPVIDVSRLLSTQRVKDDPVSAPNSLSNSENDVSASDSISSVQDPSIQETTTDHSVTPSSSSNSGNPRVSRHRPSRSIGPSALEKVLSKTRPSFLPPKQRQEDRKHLADWEKMMKQSRAAGELYPLVRSACYKF